MPKERAHDLQEKTRTDDVLVEDDICFKDLLLSNSTLKGLESSGFKYPSPIQRKAIPLGRCGFDLIVQAKSGTGKTCVFTIVALEMLKPDVDRLQVLILSPTREISVQIKDVISTIGKGLKNLNVKAFIGGLPMETDKKNLHKCQIAVGAPGRVKHLMTAGLMNVDAVRLFVLDEADKLMEESFRADVGFIYLTLPEMKQVIATSATFPPKLNEFIAQYMSSPMRVSLEKGIFLKGIRQFVTLVPSHNSVLNQMNNKVKELIRILTNISFKQCLVFSNYQSRAESLSSQLSKEGWPAIYINGSQSQTIRLRMMSDLKEFRCRVFVSTDLTARGIDAENVNLVVNLDLPYDGATYMHRIGRAGRYGSHGIAITIVQDGSEYAEFKKMLKEIGGRDVQVSMFPPGKLDFDIWKAKEKSFQKMSAHEWECQSTKKLSACPENGPEKGEKSMENLIESKEKSNEISKTESVSNDSEFQRVEKLIFGSETIQKRKLKSFSQLLEDSNRFKGGNSTGKLPSFKNEFTYEDYPQHVVSTVNFIEENWEKFQRKLEEASQETSEKGKESKFLPQPTDVPCTNKNNGQKSAEENNGGRQLEQEKPEESSSEKMKNEVFEGGDDENEEKAEESSCEKQKNEILKGGDDDDDDDSDGGDDSEHASEYNDGADDENDECDNYVEKFNENWYRTWYAQLLTVRQYVHYVSAFNHDRKLLYL